MRGKDRGVRSGRGSNRSEGWEDVSIGVKGEREGRGDERLNLRGRKSQFFENHITFLIKLEKKDKSAGNPWLNKVYVRKFSNFPFPYFCYL